MGMTLLLGILGIAIVVVAVLLVYLVDRFNALERETQEIIRNMQAGGGGGGHDARPGDLGPYGGLSGQALWDALTGSPPPGMDELSLDGVRKRYRLLLGDHIAHVFQAGVSDAAKGMDGVPSNSRLVRTPLVQVESWLPTEAVAEIYRCGQAYSPTSEDLPALRQRLDAVCAPLYIRTGLEMLQPMSSLLMPAAPEAAGG